MLPCEIEGADAIRPGRVTLLFHQLLVEGRYVRQSVHADLQNNGVRCWFAPHDLPIGAKTWDASMRRSDSRTRYCSSCQKHRDHDARPKALERGATSAWRQQAISTVVPDWTGKLAGDRRKTHDGLGAEGPGKMSSGCSPERSMSAFHGSPARGWRTRSLRHSRRSDSTAAWCCCRVADAVSNKRKPGRPSCAPTATSATSAPGKETRMDEEIRKKIVTLLDQHRIMTIATLRAGRLAAGDDSRLCERRPGALFSLRSGQPEGGKSGPR